MKHYRIPTRPSFTLRVLRALRPTSVRPLRPSPDTVIALGLVATLVAMYLGII